MEAGPSVDKRGDDLTSGSVAVAVGSRLVSYQTLSDP